MSMTSIDSLFAQERWQEARDVLAGQLAAGAASAGALVKLARAESNLGCYRLAAAYIERASTMRPESIETLTEVLSQLRMYNNADAFFTYLKKLGPPARMPIPVLLASAQQLSFLNQQELAHEYAEEAFRADPDYPPTLLAMAQLSMYLGNPKRAIECLRKVQQRAAEIPETYWLLAQLGKQVRGGIDDAKAAEAQLSREGVDTNGKIHFNYALHRFHDDAGDHDRAFDSLEKGMQAKRRTLRYSGEGTRSLVDLLKSLPTSVATPGYSSASRKPVFVVGMHRSGTTLLEQLLSAHPKVRGIGELYDFTCSMRHETDHHCRGVVDSTLVEKAISTTPDYPMVGKRYMDGIEWRLGPEAMFTDKLPSNFLNVGFIAQALPDARILHMVRDPVETCFSGLRELFSEANPYSYDQVEIAEYYAMYLELMAHWKERFPGRIFDVDYARLTTDTTMVMSEVAAFCGLGFESGMASTSSSQRSVATASAMQVRGDVVRRDTPKWKPYELRLQPLIARLRELDVPGVDAG